MTRPRGRLPELFLVACGILNGDIPVPEAARPENPAPTDWAGGVLREAGIKPAPYVVNADSLGALQEIWIDDPPWGRSLAWGSRGGRAREDNRARRALFRALAPQGVTRQDVLDLVDFLRAQYRYRTYSPVRKALYVEYALPQVREQWPPPLTAEEWTSAWRWMRPHTRGFRDFCSAAREWFGAESTASLLRTALTRAPRTFEDAYVCLLAAFEFDLHDKAIRPCLACPRFFVATKGNRETCSDACRQRLYRGSQNQDGRIRLRKQAAEYKRAQRRRKRQAEMQRRPQGPSATEAAATQEYGCRGRGSAGRAR